MHVNSDRFPNEIRLLIKGIRSLQNQINALDNSDSKNFIKLYARLQNLTNCLVDSCSNELKGGFLDERKKDVK